ncbi:MAG: U32 family peptidase [Clostridia bacterium]|nr:U32 family peptidase [Clostridia bacterium]
MQPDKSTAFSNAAGRNRYNEARKPELLCPAGSPAAFDAAIEAGADAIYIGSSSFNARINAKNFTPDEMRDAISRAHSYGIKVYIAANTLVFDRELDEYARIAEQAYIFGADALIVADMGAASMIKRRIPEIELHASTQLSGHNAAAAKRLAEAGFSRMVCAREMSGEDLKTFIENSPIEAEVFVHGALCVCHSGQCLFSSLVGQRSGNRGECGQPCRLPYHSAAGKNRYPLSLKDLCLAGHVRELIDMGVASFKIEGRMKSPEYVRDVTRIWRRLLDEKRDATPDEISELARIFSRGGFTDGYYAGSVNGKMMGVRSEKDKNESKRLDAFGGITRRLPLEFKAEIREGKPISLTVLPHDITVFGDIPERAVNAPLDADTVKEKLSKLGGTSYELKGIDIAIDAGLIVPLSKLNALRRSAIEAIEASNEKKRSLDDIVNAGAEFPAGKRESLKTAVFYNAKAVTRKARDFFDIIYLPLDAYDGSAEGVFLPAVVFDSEYDEVRSMLKAAKERGAKHALAGNVGHIDLVIEAGLIPHGDFRLNVSNNYSMRECERLGFEDVILSPELTLPRIRDIGGRSLAVVYGRISLMVTEKCVGKEISDCKSCADGKIALVDRKNVSFPVFREWKHRSIIFNSLPVFMADRQSELERANVSMRHFIFSDESPSEVDYIIDCYLNKRSHNKPVRRMN